MFLHNPVSNAVSQPLLLILMSLTRFQLGFISLPSDGSIVSSSSIAVSAVKCLVTSLFSLQGCLVWFGHCSYSVIDILN